MLTGGNSVKEIYSYWKKSSPWQHSKIRYSISDERCVPEFHKMSNFGMIKNVYFYKDMTKYRLFNFNSKNSLYINTKKFEKYTNNLIDILLLSLGEDGHFASIFPNTGQIFKKGALIISKAKPYNRISISADIVKKSKKVFVLVSGKKKAYILKRILNSNNNTNELPGKILLNSSWILDYEASQIIKKII